MFTVGIFSTHLPYVAFVFFYAFFFIFGIQKVSAGEVSSEASVKILSVKTDAHTNFSEGYNIYSSQDNTVSLFQLTDYKYFNDKIQKIFIPHKDHMAKAAFYTALFCRPPPIN
jgi:hypothetical protein